MKKFNEFINESVGCYRDGTKIEIGDLVCYEQWYYNLLKTVIGEVVEVKSSNKLEINLEEYSKVKIKVFVVFDHVKDWYVKDFNKTAVYKSKNIEKLLPNDRRLYMLEHK